MRGDRDQIGDDLVERSTGVQLVRAAGSQQRLDRGDKLDSDDLAFLEEVRKDSSQVKSLVAKHPEYQGLVDKLAALYEEISRKGLENERKGK